MEKHSIFEFLPFETLISNDQDAYHRVLAQSDKSGTSTAFIEYMLEVIVISLNKLLDFNNRVLKERDRLEFFISLNKNEFSRKNYMNVFKDISTATASRDLKKGLELNLLEKVGEGSKTRYLIKSTK